MITSRLTWVVREKPVGKPANGLLGSFSAQFHQTLHEERWHGVAQVVFGPFCCQRRVQSHWNIDTVAK